MNDFPTADNPFVTLGFLKTICHNATYLWINSKSVKRKQIKDYPMFCQVSGLKTFEDS